MSRLILAADGLTAAECASLVSKLGDRLYAVKIHDLYDLYGPEAVHKMRECGAPRVWVDHKLHDIEETVRLRARAIASSGAHIVTVHASGGIDMMRAACESGLEVYAVTLLTSLNERDVRNTYSTLNPAEKVIQFAKEAASAGVHGIVCSPRQVSAVAALVECHGLKRVTPGVRSAGVSHHDQQNVETPAIAVQNGATHLVIGRQLTKAEDPIAEIERIQAEMASHGRELT